MAEKTKKHDFIELEFIGKNLNDNEVFDTNIKEEAKKINPNVKEVKPLVLCIGADMVVKGLDEAIIDKETEKKYTIKLTPEKAFGKRDGKLIKLVPKRFFIEQKINPVPGMTLALDNSLVKIVSSSGGRVMIDFNNPLAGKDVEYEFTIKKIISDNKEKVNALQRFLFGKEFEFEIDEAKKMITFSEIQLMPILNAFKEKFNELLGFDVEILAKKKKDEKTEVKENKK
jgi:FKBP-type peptidyl-prolyl cis-trans isomerase SlyD